MLFKEANFDIYSFIENDQTFDRRELDFRRGDLKLSKSYQAALNNFLLSHISGVLFVCLFLSCHIKPLLDIFAD